MHAGSRSFGLCVVTDAGLAFQLRAAVWIHTFLCWQHVSDEARCSELQGQSSQLAGTAGTLHEIAPGGEIFQERQALTP